MVGRVYCEIEYNGFPVACSWLAFLVCSCGIKWYSLGDLMTGVGLFGEDLHGLFRCEVEK